MINPVCPAHMSSLWCGRWDIRANRKIHKFDQLTSHHGYGSWHPSGDSCDAAGGHS